MSAERAPAAALAACRPSLRGALLIPIALLALAGLMTPDRARAAEPGKNPFYELPESPETDPFYKAPEGFESASPGTVLRSREVLIPELPDRSDKAYQLLFRSNNTFDEPIVAVTTLIVPATPWAGVGKRPFVAYTPAIDGLGSECNPSYELRLGNEGELAVAGPMLERGWEVDIPDFEGENMEYGDGPIAAHVTLDSIRAAYGFAPAEVGPSNPLGTGGYSGGGQASAWTLEAQRTYAPELHFAAGAPGGIPVDLNELASSDNGTIGFSIVLAAGLGVDRGYPELGLLSLLNAEGEAAVKKIEDQCIDEFVSEYPNRKFGEFTKPQYPEPLALSQVENVLSQDSLGTQPGMPNDGLPDSPVFLWQSAADELVPVAGVDRLADYYCSEGVDVTYDRGASGEHVTYVDNAPAAIAYLEARFNGEAVPNTCGVNASENTSIDSGPSGTVEERSATFTYSAEPEVAGTTFECRLDGGAFEGCPSSGVTYTGLAAGAHTFAVRSVTATGDEDVSPAVRSYTVAKATCAQDSGTVTVSPGLTDTATVQTIKIKGTLAGCTGEPFTTAKYAATLKTPAPVSCSVLSQAGEPAAGALRVTWNPKARASRGTLSLLPTETPNAPLSGELTSGSYAPTTLTGTLTERYVGGTTCGSESGKRAAKAVRNGTFSGSAVEFG